MEPTTLLMSLLGVAVGALGGALAYAGWMRRRAGAKPRLPAKWPLAARGLFNSHEHEVLQWLRKTFHDHVVMAKIPVLRFTSPLDKEESQADRERWQALLAGVYTTFTVCTADGKVLGCVDVPGKRGLSQANRELKETLLSDCGIAYTVVGVKRLPTGSAMRAAFLGEIPVEAKPDDWETRGGGSTFHADMDAFAQQKMNDARQAALKELNKDSREEA